MAGSAEETLKRRWSSRHAYHPGRAGRGVWGLGAWAARNLAWSIRDRVALYYLVAKHPDCIIGRRLIILSPTRLHLGHNVLIKDNCFFHCGGRPWSNYRGSIAIGDDSYIEYGAILFGAGGIEIGNNVGFGPNVGVYSSHDHIGLEYLRRDHRNLHHKFRKIVIRDHVRVFANAVISGGATIGEGAVISAGSVVLNDIPPYVVAGGVPARVLRDRR